MEWAAKLGGAEAAGFSCGPMERENGAGQCFVSRFLAPLGIPWRCTVPDVVEDPRLIVGPEGRIHLGMTLLICPQQGPDCEVALCRITGRGPEEEFGVSDYGVYSSVCGAPMEKNWGFFKTPAGSMLVV